MRRRGQIEEPVRRRDVPLAEQGAAPEYKPVGIVIQQLPVVHRAAQENLPEQAIGEIERPRLLACILRCAALSYAITAHVKKETKVTKPRTAPNPQ